ncbi:Stk1 family PASTA domain-containing Ser/Thr kinase [Tsukamurella sp. 8F]|uniref:Stk1 family PASTA domain-containing Ser/Thr kinase n=1 Tax=unclassified Tsukamurella TaxID=2633480 RepID=UPI0023B95ED7|nr:MULTISPECIES: Stk1 family PASTA domain-containing Ser/Thr kinase [unclassified Tsukamurella]MDF0529379.1 Stk1 family PASTA domain-containing Ser/Thr kinase [Tsukamurella sp. 8J]MDF0587114.1 Stk1 family PASTA domain-containing Ser/Thr kinase [Tsukamurella sp. 8F]
MTTPPRRISDRYELGDTLGFGGMSEVHLARDTRLSRDVAIKILRADLARDPSFYLRFRREAQNAASLNHPTIVQVYDTGEAETPTGPLPYIVMEYVDGETLRDVLRRDGHIAPRTAMTWMADVCAALDFSHKNGIVHRDMKPANVMLSKSGEIKVMDFGIARAMSDPNAGMTQTAAVIGTAQYLSPEQARGETVDARSDVYAAGCVLFELLTGEPPFTGDSPVSVAYQHVREDPRTPSAVLSSVPPELDSIVLKAISKNPANRYQTAGEMRQDLIRVLAGRKPEAPMIMSDADRDFMLGGASRGRGRQAAAAGAAGAAGATAAGATGTSPAKPDDGESPSDDVDPDAPTQEVRKPRVVPPARHAQGQKRNRTRLILAISAAVIVAILAVVGLAYWLNSSGGTPHETEVSMPNQIGKPASDAQVALQRLGFDVQTRRENSDTVPLDHVITTNPTPDARAVKGQSVTMVVSSGPKIALVPDVTGKPQQQATDQLTKAGFTVDKDVTRTSSASVAAGSVVSTNPAGRTNVPLNQPIKLTVSTGPEQIRVPDVTNQQVDQAKSNLSELGFKVTTSDVESDQPTGTVVGQNPTGGTTVTKGSAVSLQVAKQPPKITMPRVTGMDLNAAKAALISAGFTGTINVDGSVKSNLPWTDNQVYGQSPGTGAQVDANGSVTLKYWARK